MTIITFSRIPDRYDVSTGLVSQTHESTDISNVCTVYVSASCTYTQFYTFRLAGCFGMCCTVHNTMGDSVLSLPMILCYSVSFAVFQERDANRASADKILAVKRQESFSYRGGSGSC